MVFFSLEEEMELMERVVKSIEEADEFVSTAKSCPRPAKERNMTILSHQMQLMYSAKNLNNLEDSVFITNLTTIRHSSLVADINELEPIFLKDMHVNKVHKGKYLLCKTVTDPFCINFMNTVIHDEHDEVENLVIYYYTPDYSIEPSVLLPRASILLIKEPLLISRTQDPASCYLRVESPTDLVILSDLDCPEKPISKIDQEIWMIKEDLTYEQLNAQGNKFFVEKKYHQAVRSYTRALNLWVKTKSATNKEVKKTLNNRSLANFRLERFYSAYQDALRSSQIEMKENDDEAVTINEKTYFRMGKALYSMREYSDSVIWFTKCVELNPKNRESFAELAKAQERVRESETGEYNMKRIIDECKANQLRLDLADYVSPDIEITSLNNNPNFLGVVAKADIKRNTLLVGSKALSITYEQECTKNKTLTVYQDIKQAFFPALSQNVQSMIHKVQNNPFMASQVYKLHAGPNVDRTKPISEFVVDTQRLETSVRLNSFKSETNSIINEAKTGEEDSTSALFLFPSYFNHSCLPNVIKFTCSDLMLVYTTRDIKKGEELTMTYIGVAPYERRRTFLAKMGFQCNCRLCELDSKDPNIDARLAYVTEQAKKLRDYVTRMQAQKKIPDMKRADDFVQKVREMYVDKREANLQLDLIDPLVVQAKFYLEVYDVAKLVEIYTECYELHKDIDARGASSYLFLVVIAYSLRFVMPQMRKWFKKARDYTIGHKDLVDFVCRKELAQIRNLDVEQFLKEV